MTLQRYLSPFLAGMVLLGFAFPSTAEGERPSSRGAQEGVADVFPTDTRDVPRYQQDDHMHTTPDQAVARFERLDADGDERLAWKEMQAVKMESHIFETLDTDGSGDLDEEEYVAISPSPESDYITPGLTEP